MVISSGFNRLTATCKSILSINGPESFTPDGNFILGEAPETRGVFVGAGFNAFGIAAGGGAGMVLAEWVAKGEPPYDLWPVDIRRFGRNHLDTNWVRTRTLEAYAHHYTMAWPFEEFASGRPLRRSPLYDRLKAEGAVFGVFGNTGQICMHIERIYLPESRYDEFKTKFVAAAEAL